MTTINLKMSEYSSEKLDKFVQNLTKQTQSPITTIKITRSQAVIALINAALDEHGNPLFNLDAQSPQERELKRKFKSQPWNVPLSFKIDDGSLAKLDAFVRWLAGRSIAQTRIDRATAIRTIVLDALNHEGKIFANTSSISKTNIYAIPSQPKINDNMFEAFDSKEFIPNWSEREGSFACGLSGEFSQEQLKNLDKARTKSDA